ncbi:unnamed protein product [Ectocarpus sp. 6 AP-2014]
MASEQGMCDVKRKHDSVEDADVEKWAPVGFHADYEVSTHGRMRNVTTSNLVQAHKNNTSGLYTKTFPGNNTWVIAKLVLTVFKRPQRENENAIYIDKDVSNLRLSNLRWSLGGNPSRVPNAARASRKIKVTEASTGGSTIYESSKHVEQAIGIHYSSISKHINDNTSWRGYRFEYVFDNTLGGGIRVRSLKDLFDCDGGRIFSDGRIQMPGGNIIKATESNQDPRGYTRVSIITNQEREKSKANDKIAHGTKHDIHRLVAMAFLPSAGFTNPKVDHINGKKWDNRVENLQYVTHRENMRRAHASGNIEAPHQKKVKLYEFDNNINTYIFQKEYDNMTTAGKDNDCSQGAVKKSCHKKKEDFSKARKHAKSLFFKTHVFRFSEDEL